MVGQRTDACIKLDLASTWCHQVERRKITKICMVALEIDFLHLRVARTRPVTFCIRMCGDRERGNWSTKARKNKLAQLVREAQYGRFAAIICYNGMIPSDLRPVALDMPRAVL